MNRTATMDVRTPREWEARSHASGLTRALAPVGRAFYAALFLIAAPGHFLQPTIEYAAQNGVPLPQFLVPASGVLALLGGASVLLGYKAKWGAWLLVAFLIPVTLAMHAFWAIPDPIERGIQQAMFFKNLSMLGGALLIAHFGAGPMSLDHRAA
jgi:putative oxidoreductase